MRSRFAWNILFARMHSYSLQHKYDESCLTDYFEVKTDHTVNIVQILYTSVLNIYNLIVVSLDDAYISL